MRRTLVLTGVVLLAAGWVWLGLCADPVLASTSQVGKNIGDAANALAPSSVLAGARPLTASPIVSLILTWGGQTKAH